MVDSLRRNDFGYGALSLLVRQRDRHDRRAYAVELTDHGRQRLDACGCQKVGRRC
jgi:DNA-binding MarR family transcriptional regulator